MQEIRVCKYDAGYNPYNISWIVIREDDPRFSGLAAKWPGEVREIVSPGLYEGSTAYDFQGPEDGPRD